MGRIRTIKPEFCSSSHVAKLSREARLFFLVLLTEADDAGRLPYLKKKLAGTLFPYDDDVTPTMIGTWVDECVAQDMIEVYEAAGNLYLNITNFSKHQVVNRPTPSRNPHPPVIDDSLKDHGGLTEDSLKDQCLEIGNRKEELEEEERAQSRILEERRSRESRMPLAIPSKELFIVECKIQGIGPPETEALWVELEADGWQFRGDPINDWRKFMSGFVAKLRIAKNKRCSGPKPDIPPAMSPDDLRREIRRAQGYDS